MGDGKVQQLLDILWSPPYFFQDALAAELRAQTGCQSELAIGERLKVHDRADVELLHPLLLFPLRMLRSILPLPHRTQTILELTLK